MRGGVSQRGEGVRVSQKGEGVRGGVSQRGEGVGDGVKG